MLVQNINQSNYSINHRAISAKYKGLYTQYPKYKEGLLEKLESNPKVAEIIKNKNLKVVFNAILSGYSRVESSLKIYYALEPRNILEKLFPKYRKMEMSISQNAFGTEESLQASTNCLKSSFVSREKTEDADYHNIWSGLLDWRLRNFE